MAKNKMFLYCGKCNKKLIERLPNGLFKFVFGKGAPVQLIVFGSIKIRCFRKTVIDVDKDTGRNKYEECGHWNTFNFFPGKEDFNQPSAEGNAISGDDKSTEALAK